MDKLYWSPSTDDLVQMVGWTSSTGRLQQTTWCRWSDGQALLVAFNGRPGADGRMDKLYWSPSTDDLVRMVHVLCKDDELDLAACS
jgi:hypothetical protein